MRLTIEHELRYRFSEPTHHSIQYLRLTPRNESSQRSVSWQITTPGNLRRWTDGFGNTAHVSVQNGLHDEVSVLLRGEIETVDTFGMLPVDDGLPPPMFSRTTPLTEANEAICDWSKEYGERVSDEGTIAALHALMHGLNAGIPRRMASDHQHRQVMDGSGQWQTMGDHHQAQGMDGSGQRQTAGDFQRLPAAKVLERGAVDSADYAHLFIACCRCLRVPARYVSGFLLVFGGGKPELVTHAWAEAYVDDRVGWISFDPWHGRSATEEYIRLALAFDLGGGEAIRGVQKGGHVQRVASTVAVS